MVGSPLNHGNERIVGLAVRYSLLAGAMRVASSIVALRTEG